MLNEKGDLILRYIVCGEKGIYFWSKIALNVFSFPHTHLIFFFSLWKRPKQIEGEELKKQIQIKMRSNMVWSRYILVSVNKSLKVDETTCMFKDKHDYVLWWILACYALKLGTSMNWILELLMGRCCSVSLLPDVHFAKLPFLYNLTLGIERRRVWILMQEEAALQSRCFLPLEIWSSVLARSDFCSHHLFPAEAFSVVKMAILITCLSDASLVRCNLYVQRARFSSPVQTSIWWTVLCVKLLEMGLLSLWGFSDNSSDCQQVQVWLMVMLHCRTPKLLNVRCFSSH